LPPRCTLFPYTTLFRSQEAMDAIDEPQLHSAALLRHADGLRRHVKDLSDRAYPKACGDRALDITVAFVPIEGALSAALGADPELDRKSIRLNSSHVKIS